jgi:nucleoside-diphosphate-sugar epimerase
MIVGNGLIANAFRDSDREDVIFFASGVSNSLETNPSEFQREENLIRKTISENPDKLFVYFSTCSIYDSSKSDSPYVNHKLNMEHIIANEAQKYIIARVSNAVGKGGNPNLLMNYIHRSIINQDKITIHQNAKRNLIAIDDVRKMILMLVSDMEHNKIYNIAFVRNFSISEVVSTFEKVMNLPAQKEILDLGESYSIDLHGLETYFQDENPNIYLEKLINTYYN